MLELAGSDGHSGRLSRVTLAGLVALAAAVTGLAVRGMLDLAEMPYAGFNARQNRIVRVVPRGPADLAGFKVGDVMLEDGGINAADGATLALRRPWARVGEARTYVLERQGERVEAVLCFTGMPPREVAPVLARAVVGLSFMVACLLAHHGLRQRSTALLALVGISAASALAVEPYLSSPTADRVYWACQGLLMIAGLTSLTRFVMLFPEEVTWSRRRLTSELLYGSAALLALLLVLTELVPVVRLDGAPRVVVGILSLAFLLAQVVTIPLLVVRGWLAATPAGRVAFGLNGMLLGTFIGLAPVVVMGALNLAAPGLWLPGTQYYALSLIAIPVTFTLACRRRYRALAAATS